MVSHKHVIVLRCDGDGPHAGSRNNEFEGDSEQDAKHNARFAGWKINGDFCYCSESCAVRRSGRYPGA